MKTVLLSHSARATTLEVDLESEMSRLERHPRRLQPLPTPQQARAGILSLRDR